MGKMLERYKETTKKLKEENLELKQNIKDLGGHPNSKKPYTCGYKNRKQILKRDNHKCRLCGYDRDIGMLQVHHLTPVTNGGTQHSWNLITLCYSCHIFMHCNPNIVMTQKINHSKRTKDALNYLKENGKKLGRPNGSKDKQPRKKEGYYARWGYKKNLNIR